MRALARPSMRAPVYALVRAVAPTLLAGLVLGSPALGAARPEGAAREALERFGCGACHVIPGVPEADGRTGPPLEEFGRQAYIAGRLPNTRAALARWLIDPPAIKPDTAMPALGVDPAAAQVMADWLLAAP